MIPRYPNIPYCIRMGWITSAKPITEDPIVAQRRERTRILMRRLRAERRGQATRKFPKRTRNLKRK